MARLLTLPLCLALVGCFRAPAYSPERSVAKWRSTQTPLANDAPAQDGASLTAEETYKLALQNNPELAALQARAETADARVKQARQITNPQLRFQNINVDDVVARNSWVDIAVRFYIPRPGELHAQAQAAKLVAEGERTLTDDAKRMLRARVHRMFALLAMLEDDLEHATAAAELAKARRDLVAARVEATVATDLDLALADVAAAETATEAQTIQDEAGRVRDSLRRLAGVDEGAQFLTDEVREPLAKLERDVVVEKAVRSRPELRAAQAGVGEAKAQQYLARNRSWPWFQWGQVDYFAGPNSTAQSWGFGVALSLPVFSWNLGEIKATRALVRQREAEEVGQVSLVAGEVDEALTALERTAGRVDQLDTVLIPKTDAAEKAARAAEKAGSLDPLKANDVAARAVAARRQLVAAKFDHAMALVDLEAAVGAPL